MNIIKNTIAAAILLATGTFISAHAATKQSTTSSAFNYTYVEAGFADYDQDTALQARGSFELTDEFFLAGTLALSDVKLFKVGVGYRYTILDNLDVYGIGGFAKYDIESPLFPNVDDSGLNVTAGARYEINNDFEVGAGLDIFAGDNSDTKVFASGTYHINDQFSFSAEYLGGDFDNIFLSGRYNF